MLLLVLPVSVTVTEPGSKLERRGVGMKNSILLSRMGEYLLPPGLIG